MRAWTLNGRHGSLPLQPWLSSTASSWPGEGPDVGVPLLAPARPCLRGGDTCGRVVSCSPVQGRAPGLGARPRTQAGLPPPQMRSSPKPSVHPPVCPGAPRPRRRPLFACFGSEPQLACWSRLRSLSLRCPTVSWGKEPPPPQSTVHWRACLRSAPTWSPSRSRTPT